MGLLVIIVSIVYFQDKEMINTLKLLKVILATLSSTNSTHQSVHSILTDPMTFLVLNLHQFQIIDNVCLTTEYTQLNMPLYTKIESTRMLTRIILTQPGIVTDLSDCYEFCSSKF
jgi:hypothetical protein